MDAKRMLYICYMMQLVLCKQKFTFIFNVQYFQNLKLFLPCDVCWNNKVECLSSYIKNWSILMKISEEHRNRIDTIIYNNYMCDINKHHTS